MQDINILINNLKDSCDKQDYDKAIDITSQILKQINEMKTEKKSSKLQGIHFYKPKHMQNKIRIRKINKIRIFKQLFQNQFVKLRTKIMELENNIINKIVKEKSKIKELKYKLHDKSDLAKSNIQRKIANIDLNIKKLTKSDHQLAKQKLMMALNTVKNTTLRAKIAGIKLENKILNSANDVKYNLINKKEIAKNKVRLKVINIKNNIKTVTKNKIDELKTKINSALLSATTYVGVKTIDLKDNIKQNFHNTKEAVIDKVNYGKTAVGVGLLDFKDKLEDKKLLAKDRIESKFSSIKNIISHKTGMQIALFKQDIKKALENSQINYDQNKDLIEKLKNQRNELLNQLLNSNINEQPVVEASRTY